MALRSRPFSDDDMPRLQAELAGWIGEAGWCGYGHVGALAHRVYATLRGRRPVGALVQVWEDGGRLAGVAICGLFGAAFDVLACPADRGGAAELMMLEEAAATTLRLVGGRAEVITDAYGCDTARRQLLGRLGFSEYRQWDDVNLRDLADPVAEARPPAGFTVRPATMADGEGLAEARNSAFGEGWAPGEYGEQVMRRPGYLPEREIVAVAPDGQIAAFAVAWRDDLNRAGLFEPVGTARGFQRRGLARAIMSQALAEMRRLGMQTALVSHDATNLAARALYASLGFRKAGETLGYRRQEAGGRRPATCQRAE